MIIANPTHAKKHSCPDPGLSAKGATGQQGGHKKRGFQGLAEPPVCR